jgi:CubicO group peptidase (beta-lactamase class C family)
MRKVHRHVALLLLASCAFAQRSPSSADGANIHDVRAKVNLQNWDDGGELSRWVYLHSTEVFPSAIVRREGRVRELPLSIRPEIGDFELKQGQNTTSLRDYIDHSALDGFIIVHKGVVVYEQYPHMAAADSHLLFSVTKAFVGTALGMLEADGKVDLDQPIEHYLPEFAGSAWAGTRVRDIADMASGMEGAEDTLDAYTNPAHKQFQMEASLGWQPLPASLPQDARAGDTYKFLTTFKRVRKAGEARVYTSANTEVLAAMLERVTGKPLASVISELIWSKIGAEHDAHLLINSKGYPIAHAGMVMTLRDLARFGLFFTASRKSNDSAGVPAAFLAHLLKPRIPALNNGRQPSWFSHATYQWDFVGKSGQIGKGGFAEQLLFIDTQRDVVIAYLGTNPDSQSLPRPLPLVAVIDKYFPK